MTEQRQATRFGLGLRGSQRNRKDRIGAESSLVICAVEFDHALIERALIVEFDAEERFAAETPDLARGLMELRDRLLRIVLVVLAILVILLPFANHLFVFIATPLMEKLPGEMIAIGTIAPFFTPLKLSLLTSLYISVPFILYQFWAFIAPGLYQHERKMVMPLVVSSTLLFYLGTAFAYYVVFPLVFGFIVNTAPEGVEVQTDIADYLNFVLRLFFAFGVAFEIPVATIILLWTGVTTRESLAKGRPYIIVGAFVIGMLLTPPDVISQVLLALPMWVLFEAGLVASRFFIKPKSEDEELAGEEEEGIGESVSAAAATASAQASETHGAAVTYPDDYVEPTDEEMEAALDSLDEDDEAAIHELEPLNLYAHSKQNFVLWARAEGVLERIVKVHSRPGDMVVDYFAGSGTTGEAAARHGRDYWLCDSNPAAVEIMRTRLAQAAQA